MATLCLGEVLVDLIATDPAESLREADGFRKAFGGATANVAVHAARLGAEVELGGGSGDDELGAWLRERLEAEGVGLGSFVAVPHARTPLALAAVSAAGEPVFAIYGEAIGPVFHALGERIEAVAAASDGLFFGSNTLAGEAERAVTLRARAAALEAGRPVLLDANLRLHRWPTPQAARDAVAACVPGAFLVRANAEEAALLSGEADPEAAAAALHAQGARLVLVSLGPDGAILRGEVEATAPGVPVEVVSTIGAGDALTGTVLGRLALAGFDPAAAADALPEAVAASARACERRGAL